MCNSAIYYESRLAKIEIDESKLPTDDEVEEIFKMALSDEQQEKAKSNGHRLKHCW